MPTNTTIPVMGTGTVLTQAELGTLIPLNTMIGLFGVGPSFLGTTPPTNAPNVEVQVGDSDPTFSTGVATITFPTAFPNGLMGVWLTPFYSAPANPVSLAAGSGTDAAQIIVT